MESYKFHFGSDCEDDWAKAEADAIAGYKEIHGDVDVRGARFVRYVLFRLGGACKKNKDHRHSIGFAGEQSKCSVIPLEIVTPGVANDI